MHASYSILFCHRLIADPTPYRTGNLKALIGLTFGAMTMNQADFAGPELACRASFPPILARTAVWTNSDAPHSEQFLAAQCSRSITGRRRMSQQVGNLSPDPCRQARWRVWRSSGSIVRPTYAALIPPAVGLGLLLMSEVTLARTNARPASGPVKAAVQAAARSHRNATNVLYARFNFDSCPAKTR